VGDSDQVLQRNKDFAATCAHEEASIIARHQVCVITCLDPRADHLYKAQLAACSARAYMIPSEHHVAIPDTGQIVFAQAPQALCAIRCPRPHRRHRKRS
jgi:hypothetical protein